MPGVLSGTRSWCPVPGGWRSSGGASLLRQLGHSPVSDLVGGYEAWKHHVSEPAMILGAVLGHVPSQWMNDQANRVRRSSTARPSWVYHPPLRRAQNLTAISAAVILAASLLATLHDQQVLTRTWTIVLLWTALAVSLVVLTITGCAWRRWHRVRWTS